MNKSDLIKKAFNKLVSLTDEDRQNILQFNPDIFTFDDNLDWYLSKNNKISKYTDFSHNIFENYPTTQQDFYFTLISYSRANNEVTLYVGIYDGYDKGRRMVSCISHKMFSYKGVLSPAVGQTTRLYFNNDASDSMCTDHDMPIDMKRQHFVDMTMLPVGGAELMAVPAFNQ
mgnify:CR=1 FL=1